MYRVEVYGNGIYVGKVIPVKRSDSDYMPVFVGKQHDKYWDAYDEADAWIRKRTK